MERTEGELRTGFTDSLGSDDADSLTLLHHAAGGEVAAIALHADALLRLAGEHGANLDTLNLSLLDLLGQRLGNLLAGRNDDFASLGVDNVVDADTAKDALRQT